jgi:predicted ATP-dependent protease
VNIKEKGYNIYISGSSGSGRTYYAKKYLEKISRQYKIPDDWCYVYNFRNKFKPLELNFAPGFGRVFKQDMEYLINEMIEKIPLTFNSAEYDRQKNEILEDYHNIKNQLVDELSGTAESSNLQVKATSTGFAFVPIVEGKPLSEEEYDSMDTMKREEILKNIAEMRIKAMEILRRLKNAEKEADKKVKKLENEVGLYIIDNIIDSIRRKYISKEKVLEYFTQLKDDIQENLSTFISGIDKHSTSKEEDELLSRYGVNLIVDNSETQGAPVVYEINPTFNNLMGNIEYESKLGTITSDYLMIRAGSVLKANGGFLIVNIDDVLKNYQAWEGLKRVLKSGEITVEGIRSQLDLLTIVTVKPEPIPVDIKVVLIGTEQYFHLLFELDSEFSNLFKCSFFPILTIKM